MIIVLIRETKYLNGNPEIPVYEETSNHYTAKEIVETLLDKTIPLTKITTTQPVSCQDNFTFVVDISKLDKPEDIRCDDLGSPGNVTENGVHIAVLTMMDMLCPSAQLNQYKMHITFML